METFQRSTCLTTYLNFVLEGAAFRIIQELNQITTQLRGVRQLVNLVRPGRDL